jgi:tRNA threonylcarbamoyladenosine biosynthesis protein TsaE
MGEVILTTDSPEETERLGEALGQLLRPGDFVGLVGDLGAGKTRLVRGLARGAGVPEGEVTSPTFAIVQSYRGRIAVHHADLYRLAESGEDELYATGFFDLMDELTDERSGGGGAMVVEWLDRIPTATPDDALLLRLSSTDDCTRRIQATETGVRSGSLLAEWSLVVAAGR